jgi:hypothetical protein
VGGTCGEQIFFDVPGAGRYTVEFDYGSTNDGYAWFTVVNANSQKKGGHTLVGSPNSPRILSETSQNPIPKDPFLGFYQTTLQAGEKLIISGALSPAYNSTDNRRCTEQPSAKYFKTYIAIFDDQYDEKAVRCGNYYEFTAPADGLYIIHPYYYAKDSGQFGAAIF